VDEPPSNALINIISFQGITHAVVFSAIAILVILSALISACEAAFFSLQPKELDKLTNASNSQKMSVIRVLEDPQLLWLTLLVANVFARTALAIFVALLWADTPTTTLRSVIVLTTLFLVVIGEVLPRILGKTWNTSLAHATAGVWSLLQVFMRPFSAVVTRMKKMSRKPAHQESTAEVLSHAIEIAAGIDGTSEGEKEILKGIAIFGTLTVTQVMRSRTEVSAVNVKFSFEELMDFVNKSGYSRIPVYDNTLDSIAGVLYIKDLLPFLERPADFEWQSLVRPGFFVPETKKIDLLLKDFQEKRVHMAIVRGEYGGTVGLVTLEDLIEEIIGEINDEFDEVEYLHKKIDNRTYVFDGKTLLQDLCKTLEVDPKTFDSVKGISETVSGLLLEINRKFPSAGDQINYEQFTFVIESVDRKRVKRVRVKIHEQA